MKSEKRFYVYVHRRKTDGSIFYVGKGTGGRKDHTYGKTKWWRSIATKNGWYSEIIYKNLTEDCAYSIEKILINLMSERLCNISSGGTGGLAGKPKSPEHVKKVADAHRGMKRSEATKKLISDKAKNRLKNPKKHHLWNEYLSLWYHPEKGMIIGSHLDMHIIECLPIECLKKVQSGSIYSYHGWKVAGVRNEMQNKGGLNNNTSDKRVFNFYKEGEANFIGTRADFCLSKGVNSNSISRLISGANKTMKGWRCSEIQDIRTKDKRTMPI